MIVRTLIALLLLGGCNRAERPREAFTGAPVILISIDTLRADHLPLYGYRDVETPHIDALGRDSILYERAWSHCPMTLPSHVSMITGLLPNEHGVRNNIGFRYDARKHPPITARLKTKGYATGAAVSSYVMRGETGLRDAFDWYDDGVEPRPGAAFHEYQRSGSVTADAAATWIATVASRPFFLMLHLYEPHVPYDPPPEFRRFSNPYDGEIAAADAIVGDFVQTLKQQGIYDRAIIILTSDHGEGLGDHGEQQHGILLYEESIRVPLLVKLPKSARAGERVRSTIAHSSLVPMLEGLLGLRDEAPPPGPVYAETLYPYLQFGWSDLRSLITDQHHYIDGPRPELYDLRNDPRERRNVIAAERRVAAQLRDELQKFPRGDVAASPIDPEDAKKLAALGYVGSLRTERDPRSLANPRDHVHVVDRMQNAFHLANTHQYDVALHELQTIVDEHPGFVDVWLRLAEVYIDLGKPREAVSAYGRAISASGSMAGDVALMAGNVLLQAGQIDDAAALADVAAKRNAESARGLRIRIAIARRDFGTARELAAGLPPGDESQLLVARIAHAERRYDAALDALSVIRKPLYDAEALRGDVLARLEQHKDAMVAYEHEIATFPANRLAYSRLAILQYALGDDRAAERTLERLVTANPSPAAYSLAVRTMEAVEDVAGVQRWRAKRSAAISGGASGLRD